MRFRIELASSEPIRAQIIRQVREAVATGKVRPHDRLPTVRELAKELVTNPNTVAAAYKEMERDGLVYTRRGVGTSIGLPRRRPSAAERRRLLRPRIDALLTDAVHLGFTDEELISAIRTAAEDYQLRIPPAERVHA